MRILRNLKIHVASPTDTEGRRLFDKHSWPFKLEKEWEIVHNLKDADVVPIMFDGEVENNLRKSKLNINQTALLLAIFHIGENQTKQHFLQQLDKFKKIFPNIIILHKNLAIEDTPELVYYDCMFNRQKLYFTEYERLEKIKEEMDTEDIVWTPWVSKDTYSLPALEKDFDNDFKMFLSPNLVYEGFYVPRMRYRAGLYEYQGKFLEEHSLRSSPGNRFLPNNARPPIVKVLQGQNQGGFWYPIADEYYKRTMISTYVETLTVSFFNTRCVTEKTFDPLIKGNFILPFGYSGLIKDIIDYGFQLPPFIDYSYDKITDNDVRFENYLFSVRRMPKVDLKHEYQRHKHMVMHNRNVFFNRPYYPLYEKVRKQIEARPKREVGNFKSGI
jgi:hypothetical protein